MSFRSEKEMSTAFRNALRDAAAQARVEWHEELQGVAGIPDYVVLATRCGKIEYVVSLELKLQSWKRGLQQAQRYLNFSNEAYVVIDASKLQSALQAVEKFDRSGVGLASFSRKGVFNIHCSARASTPFSAYFAQRFALKLANAEDDDLPFARTTNGRRTLSRLNTFVSSSPSSAVSGGSRH